MPRPKKCRDINYFPQISVFKPELEKGKNGESIILSFEDLEALKLADFEGKKQIEAAKLMNISRATFGRIIEHARMLVADALIKGKTIVINGGSFCPRIEGKEIDIKLLKEQNNNIPTKCLNCDKFKNSKDYTKEMKSLFNFNIKELIMENTNFKVAIVTDDGVTVSGHFGPSKIYSVFTVENGNIINRENFEKPNFHAPGEHMHEQHHGGGNCNDTQHEAKHVAMIEPIKDCKFMICGGMGQGIYNNLINTEITPIITNLKTIEEAVMSLINGSIDNHIEKLH